jgi:hypothetical protein
LRLLMIIPSNPPCSASCVSSLLQPRPYRPRTPSQSRSFKTSSCTGGKTLFGRVLHMSWRGVLVVEVELEVGLPRRSENVKKKRKVTNRINKQLKKFRPVCRSDPATTIAIPAPTRPPHKTRLVRARQDPERTSSHSLPNPPRSIR